MKTQLELISLERLKDTRSIHRMYFYCLLLYSSIEQSINHTNGTSLVAQWIRICLPIQGTQVRALVREDPTCRGATNPVCHNYWAHVLQLLKPARLKPMLHNKRSHRNEKPTHHDEEQPLLTATRESSHAATRTQCSQKNKIIKKIFLIK